MPFEASLAAVNGASIFYAQFGRGPPILLLHGGLANSELISVREREFCRERVWRGPETHNLQQRGAEAIWYAAPFCRWDALGRPDLTPAHPV
jgi:pimeloyl-ACP methyl ester carboxylesterase